MPALNLTSDTALTQAQNSDFVSSTAFSAPGILIEATEANGSTVSIFTGVRYFLAQTQKSRILEVGLG